MTPVEQEYMKQDKTALLLIIFILAFFVSGCASAPERVALSTLERKLSDYERIINAKRVYPENLTDVRVGASGFFYILSTEGRLIVHPKALFVGADFSGLPSVREMMGRERGVVSADEGGMRRTIAFAHLYDGNILCLTIDTGDLLD
jgi:hypothetical protein